MDLYNSCRSLNWALTLVSSFVIVSNTVSANFLQLRADLTASNNGSISTNTIQPSITSSTTRPLDLSATGVTSSRTVDPDLVTSLVSSATISSTLGGTSPSETPTVTFPQQCRTVDVGDFPPFCRPMNGTDKYVGNSYYVTWDVTEFTPNSTVTILLDYVNVNATEPKGQHAWESKPTPKNVGYITLEMDPEWLQGNSRNNLSLTMQSFDATVDKPALLLKGPIISLTNPAAEHYPPPPKNTIDKLGLEIGIPVGLCFCVLIVCGLWFGMKKHRRIGLGNVMGRKKGYGVGKSRRQRMGLKRSAVPIHDSEDMLPDSPGFRDDPTRGNIELQPSHTDYARDNSLGSLANSATGDQYSRSGGNVFRDEVEKQRTLR